MSISAPESVGRLPPQSLPSDSIRAQERKGGEGDKKLAKKITGLVKKLGSSKFAEREEVQKKLLKIGDAAKKQLESVKKTGDVEVSRRTISNHVGAS